ncbi:dachshund c isoform X1 [Electrophorus electricus]|uniref:dachshund c isoform X1 n=1 Tax=Electrophorus electricus TaxID=8005 RepID=UPI0015D00750|nr:dachshund c isoform X1 [Electrophorus electricus]
MATSVPLLPSAPLAHAPPISVSASTNSSSPATLSPSPSVAPSGPGLFRSELLSSASPAIPVGSLPNKPVYSTPSPVENTPQNNECRMVEVRGAKLASFTVNGRELICLPQAFDLFLKHLVGGLHTVYTKLKRLEITPVVCNVEQVRILRGLGAIQPGVNRCKLISRKDFEVLYNDCTNASSRPGRPPKRTQSVTSPESPHILPHSVSGLMSSGMMSHTGLTAATLAEAMKKKIKMEVMSGYHGSNSHGPDSENGDVNSSMGLELPFMMMSHPLIPVSLPPASVTMAMNQMNHLSTIANMAAAAHVPARMATSVIKERVPDSPSPAPSLDDGRRSVGRLSSRQSSSASSSPAHTESSSDRPHVHQNGLSLGHALLGLSPSAPPGPKEGDLATQDTCHDTRRTPAEKDETMLGMPTSREGFERVSHAGPTLPPGFPGTLLFPEGLSSIETLLTNIQGLLKVAVDNARAQEKQVQLEKTELKMELCRERELRETLERQLCVEQKNRALIQKRLKKEKKTKRKLQEALEYESKRRDQAEKTLQQTATSEFARSPNEPAPQNLETELSDDRTDTDRTIPGNPPRPLLLGFCGSGYRSLFD